MSSASYIPLKFDFVAYLLIIKKRGFTRCQVKCLGLFAWFLGSGNSIVRHRPRDAKEPPGKSSSNGYRPGVYNVWLNRQTHFIVCIVCETWLTDYSNAVKSQTTQLLKHWSVAFQTAADCEARDPPTYGLTCWPDESTPRWGSGDQQRARSSPPGETQHHLPQALPAGDGTLPAAHGQLAGGNRLIAWVQANQHRCRLLPCCKYNIVSIYRQLSLIRLSRAQ